MGFESMNHSIPLEHFEGLSERSDINADSARPSPTDPRWWYRGDSCSSPWVLAYEVPQESILSPPHPTLLNICQVSWAEVSPI